MKAIVKHATATQFQRGLQRNRSCEKPLACTAGGQIPFVHKATAILAVGAVSVRHAKTSTVGEKRRFAYAVDRFVRAWALCSRVWPCGV